MWRNRVKRKSTANFPPSAPDIPEISIWIDSYDDIFSDFDPRPLGERAVSDDFMTEIKKFSREKKGEKRLLKLLIPADARNQAREKIVIKRLRTYFSHAYELLTEEIRRNNKQGIFLTLAGTVLMITASYISFLQPVHYYIHLLLVLFEPAGWFLLWAGLDHLVYFSRSSKKDSSFYRKMAGAEIRFFTY